MKERNQTLDYIRTFAMFCVVLYHFEIEYISRGINCFFSSVVTFFNINLGGIGVFLFFMLSGNVLHHNYKKGIDVHVFYKKRILNIFPLFWITYLVAFFIDKIFFDTNFSGVAQWKIILTFLGIDGYFPQLNPTYYLVGEWFTPVIMCIYFLYPFIRYIMITCKKLLIGLVIIDIVVLANVFNPLNIVADGNVFIAITAFVIGALLEESNLTKYSKLLYFVLPIWIFTLSTAKVLPSVILNMMVSISLYFLFLGISKFLKRNRVIEVIARYSYGVYLTHHFVIRIVARYYNLLHSSIIFSALVFLSITVVYTLLIYAIEGVIKRWIQLIIKKRSYSAIC